MSAEWATGVLKANAATERAFGKPRNSLRYGAVAMQKARGIFPIKTAQHLAEITGYTVRTCEYWLSKNRLPWEAVAAIINSEHGYQIIDAIANETSWWRRVRQALGVLDGQENELKELIHEYRALVADAKAEALLGARPEGMAGPAVRSNANAVGGKAGRAVAQTHGPGKRR